jgi:hypothetical protein
MQTCEMHKLYLLRVSLLKKLQPQRYKALVVYFVRLEHLFTKAC